MALITKHSGALEFSVDTQGAQLMNLRLNGAEYLWQGDERWWPRRAPILFPIVGVLKDGHASSAAGEVRLSRHGLARNMEHAVLSESESSVSFEVNSNPQTREAYPFDFCLNMGYASDGIWLTQTFTVTNTGKADLPYTLGGHPAFNVPVPGDGGSFDDYELRFSRPWTASTPAISTEGYHDFARQTKLLEDSDALHLSHDLFSKLLTVTLMDVPDRKVILTRKGTSHGIELRFDGFDYLGLWTANETAPFLAIEPWCGCAACKDEDGVFEHKRGMMLLPPDKSATHSFSIRPY